MIDEIVRKKFIFKDFAKEKMLFMFILFTNGSLILI